MFWTSIFYLHRSPFPTQTQTGSGTIAEPFIFYFVLLEVYYCFLQPPVNLSPNSETFKTGLDWGFTGTKQTMNSVSSCCKSSDLFCDVSVCACMNASVCYCLCHCLDMSELCVCVCARTCVCVFF